MGQGGKNETLVIWGLPEQQKKKLNMKVYFNNLEVWVVYISSRGAATECAMQLEI